MADVGSVWCWNPCPCGRSEEHLSIEGSFENGSLLLRHKQDAELLQLTLDSKVQCTKLNHADHQSNAISILLYVPLLFIWIGV